MTYPIKYKMIFPKGGSSSLAGNPEYDIKVIIQKPVKSITIKGINKNEK